MNDKFSMVQHKDGETNLMPNKSDNNKSNELDQININDLPTIDKIGVKTQYGYYCSKYARLINGQSQDVHTLKVIIWIGKFIFN